MVDGATYANRPGNGLQPDILKAAAGELWDSAVDRIRVLKTRFG